MRFVVTAEWRENHLLRLILAGFLVYVVLLWVTNTLLDSLSNETMLAIAKGLKPVSSLR